MKAENEPISSDEFVVRLIWRDYYDPSLPLPVQSGAFSPKKNETDGISIFRAACLRSPEDVLSVIAEDKRDKYAIALLKVADLQVLGLTVKIMRIESLAGHGVLPELNISSVNAEKARWRGIQKQLAITREPECGQTPGTNLIVLQERR